MGVRITAAVTFATVASLLQGCGAAPLGSFESTAHGVLVKGDGVQVQVAVEGELAFRVSIAHDGTPSQRASQMLAEKTSFAKFTVTQDDSGVTVWTSFGSATISTDATSLELKCASGKSLFKTNALSKVSTMKGTTWLTVSLDKAVVGESVYYGAGADAGEPLAQDHSTPTVSNTYGKGGHSWAPQYYSATDGYGALAVGAHDWSNHTDYWTTKDESPKQPDLAKYPANWTSNNERVLWTVLGASVDLYFMPAMDTYAYMKAHADLTGRPRVPPRYAFGFLAGRWGWTSKDYIETTLNQFRTGGYPADAFISDFFFFTSFNDYAISPAGNSSYHDFGWNSLTFPEPQQQLKDYSEKLGFKFGGIRKPRFGNTESLDHLRKNGWLLPEGLFNVNGQGRNMNLSSAASKEWYQQQNQHYLEEGVQFWWNDEGEAYFFQFHDWNAAQEQGFAKMPGDKRFFTLNRVYTPGLQRFGVGVWTGDVSVSWEALAQQPGYMLNYNLAGNVYIGCDTGGFVGLNASGELLSRWYWTSAFMTTMRVHSSFIHSEHGDAGAPITPHFPFLYEKRYADAMKAALEMRYRLIPMLYSLGHFAYLEGAPITRPLLMEFSADSEAVAIQDQWLVGTGLMTAPVLSEGGKRSVYFPQLPGDHSWYVFNDSSVASKGGETMTYNVPIDQTLLFARSGTLVPVGPLVQHTGELPGDGQLEMQVYAGADGIFRFFEDDGETHGYESGNVRETYFSWTEANRTLSWKVSSSWTHPSMFSSVTVVLFGEGGTQKTESGALGKDGHLTVGKEALIVI